MAVTNRPFLWLQAGDRLATEDLGDGFALGDHFVLLGVVVQELVGSASGASTVSGTIDPPLNAASSGAATVTGFLSTNTDLQGTSSGSAAATATMDPPFDITHFDIPYTIGYGQSIVQELGVYVQELRGLGAVTATLTNIHYIEMASTPAGTSSVTGSLFLSGSPLLPADAVTGVTTVTAALDVGAPDGDGDIIYELSGSSAGVATVTVAGFQPHAEYLYIHLDIGVGYYPTDDASGRSDFSAQTSPDGDIKDLGAYLYLPLDIGVGYSPTDIYSGAGTVVSQTFPDGVIQDLPVLLYLYSTIISGFPKQYGDLVIAPGYKGTRLGAAPPTEKLT